MGSGPTQGRTGLVLLVYIDTSAVLKLIVSEPESPALQGWLRENKPRLLSSALVEVESIRACNRVSQEQMAQLALILEQIIQVPLSRSICRVAAVLQPVTLRSLDSLHLATALQLAEDIDAVLTYDQRMKESATLAGFRVASPGC